MESDMVGRIVLGEKGEAEGAEIGLVERAEGRRGGKPEAVIVDECAAVDVRKAVEKCGKQVKMGAGDEEAICILADHRACLAKKRAQDCSNMRESRYPVCTLVQSVYPSSMFSLYCLLPGTSEKDRIVAQKHFEFIQDYSLQRDTCTHTSL
jgi:hypothetical protein